MFRTGSQMDLGLWTAPSGDALRRKRLAAGYVVGFLFVSAMTGLVVLNAKAIAAEKEEDILDVKLAKEPEPEPEPQPTAQPQVEKKAPPPRAPKMQTPLEIPKDKPAEVDPSKVQNPFGNGDPFAHQDDKNEPPAKDEKPAVKEEPKPAPPKAVVAVPAKPKGPIQITENVTPPQPLSTPAPVYPPEAKAAGIEGTVVVKFVVTEQGVVTNAQVLRGPPELHAAALAAVQSWRFRPAVLDGQPVAVTKIQPLRFHIKT